MKIWFGEHAWLGRLKVFFFFLVNVRWENHRLPSNIKDFFSSQNMRYGKITLSKRTRVKMVDGCCKMVVVYSLWRWSIRPYCCHFCPISSSRCGAQRPARFTPTPFRGSMWRRTGSAPVTHRLRIGSAPVTLGWPSYSVSTDTCVSVNRLNSTSSAQYAGPGS